MIISNLYIKDSFLYTLTFALLHIIIMNSTFSLTTTMFTSRLIKLMKQVILIAHLIFH